MNDLDTAVRHYGPSLFDRARQREELWRHNSGSREALTVHQFSHHYNVAADQVAAETVSANVRVIATLLQDCVEYSGGCHQPSLAAAVRNGVSIMPGLSSRRLVGIFDRFITDEQRYHSMADAVFHPPEAVDLDVAVEGSAGLIRANVMSALMAIEDAPRRLNPQQRIVDQQDQIRRLREQIAQQQEQLRQFHRYAQWEPEQPEQAVAAAVAVEAVNFGSDSEQERL